ncbi:MAG: tyrosine-type recombinase/integrase [Peptococcaceae bacterium]|nr:tyrosine-type recombinase/integrase [Peptococcaceae bacterium]
MGRRLMKVTPKTDRPWDDCLKEFLLVKEAGGQAPRTLADYRYHVNLFFKHHPEAWANYNALRQAVLEYFAISAKLSPTTYNLRRKYLKGFFAWAVSEGIIPANPIDGLKARKTEGRIRHVPEDVLQKLLELPNRSTYAGLRDYALLLLSLDTGIRPGEALGLLPGDINLPSLEVRVRADIAKTRTSRTLPISQETAAAIRKLFSVRPEEWGNAPVFCSDKGKPLKENGWRQRLDKYKKRLGQDISPYDLRHAFALLYLRGGGDAFHLQRMMGHSDMEMTKHYLEFTKADLRETHSQASPLNRLLPKTHRARKIKT